MFWRNAEIEKKQEEISSLEQANKNLGQQIEKLDNDMTYLEKVAREDLGLLRSNETIIDFSKSSKKNKVEKQ